MTWRSRSIAHESDWVTETKDTRHPVKYKNHSGVFISGQPESLLGACRKVLIYPNKLNPGTWRVIPESLALCLWIKHRNCLRYLHNWICILMQQIQQLPHQPTGFGYQPHNVGVITCFFSFCGGGKLSKLLYKSDCYIAKMRSDIWMFVFNLPAP